MGYDVGMFWCQRGGKGGQRVLGPGARVVRAGCACMRVPVSVLVSNLSVCRSMLSLNELRTTCFSRRSQGELEVSAQAFWKMGSTTQAYLVMHVAHQICGRPTFAQWLLPPPGGPAKPLSGTLQLSQLGSSPALALLPPPKLKPAFKKPGAADAASLALSPTRSSEVAVKFLQQAREGLPEEGLPDDEEGLSEDEEGLPDIQSSAQFGSPQQPSLLLDQAATRVRPHSAPFCLSSRVLRWAGQRLMIGLTRQPRLFVPRLKQYTFDCSLQAVPNEGEADPDWVLSDLERLQKEIDDRRQPHRGRSAAAKDSPADSVISMPNDARAATSPEKLQQQLAAGATATTMLTPRGVELELDEGGGERQLNYISRGGVCSPAVSSEFLGLPVGKPT